MMMMMMMMSRRFPGFLEPLEAHVVSREFLWVLPQKKIIIDLLRRKTG